MTLGKNPFSFTLNKSNCLFTFFVLQFLFSFKLWLLLDVYRDAEDFDELEEDGCMDEVAGLESQLAEARISLAKVSRTEAKLQRLIDQVPSRPELNQYQRRFIELYNQGTGPSLETH